MESRTPLSEGSRAWLLAHARRVIAAALGREDSSPEPDAPAEVLERRGCFVSLHTRGGALRGCIGTFDDTRPLVEAVEEMAAAAATADTRFEPLGLAELERCAIEISALTPRQPIAAAEVVVGKHGLWVQCGYRRGVLLPQVPGAYGWDREAFLAHTCRKAGLPPDAWLEAETRLEAFEAEVFGEER